jgi:signal transduction histidine kinase
VGTLLYIRLIGFTFGTLLMLFWMVVILGYRRQRNFERVFFFLCLALFFFYGGSLLALNAQIYYTDPPQPLTTFAFSLMAAGLCFLPALIFHLYFEYAEITNPFFKSRLKRFYVLAFYCPVFYFALHIYPILSSGAALDLILPGNTLGRIYGQFLTVGLAAMCIMEFRLWRKAKLKPERTFHLFTGLCIGIAATLTFFLHAGWRTLPPETAMPYSTALAFLPMLPLSALIYLAQKHNFLQIGRQKNLVYAVCVTFLALLYLSLVRRVSTWLEPVLPPEASAAMLLFVLVVFFEPLQRVLSRSLRETAHGELDRAQRLLSLIQEAARQGDLENLRGFTERSVKQEFELARVSLKIFSEKTSEASDEWGSRELGTPFSIRQGERLLGELEVQPYGGMISGETTAALEFLCGQMPGALDLCRTIEEKLHLERELAERERMAVLGQMAASISHNLKNPLGSIKTILQVQMESHSLPENFRSESKMVLDEVNRLSSKLHQLLQFSRPAIVGQPLEATCDAGEIMREVTEVLRPEADRRRVSLEENAMAGRLSIAIAREALSDILTNLLVNALDAVSHGGRILVSASLTEGFCVITVEDDGTGIPPDVQEKLLQPFFTTKSQGTGLGLAIVARRVAEAKGQLDWQSPLSSGRGTRFGVRLPLAR